MKLLIWLCLLGFLASAHGIFLDKITGRGDSSGNGLLDDIFGLEDSDNSSHNKTSQNALPASGIFTPVKVAVDVIQNIWDEFSKVSKSYEYQKTNPSRKNHLSLRRQEFVRKRFVLRFS